MKRDHKRSIVVFVEGKNQIFKEIFENAVGNNRVNCKKTITPTLLNLLYSTKGDKARDDADNIKMRCFMTAILAYLPFNHLGDVLFILFQR